MQQSSVYAVCSVFKGGTFSKKGGTFWLKGGTFFKNVGFMRVCVKIKGGTRIQVNSDWFYLTNYIQNITIVYDKVSRKNT